MTVSTEKIHNNFAQTRLEEAISNTDLTCKIVDEPTQLFPRWEGGHEFYLTLVDASANREIVKVTGISGRWLTISRGQQSTTARSWPIGTLIEQRPTADDMSDIIQREGFRTVSYDPNGVLIAQYPGEKIYERGKWWKNISGTTWQLIAGHCEYPALDTFTEIDVGANRLAISADEITYTDLTDGEVAYAHKDMGIGYFDKDVGWEVFSKITLSGGTGDSFVHWFGVSYNSVGLLDSLNVSLSLAWNPNTEKVRVRWRQLDGSDYHWDFAELVPAGTYWSLAFYYYPDAGRFGFYLWEDEQHQNRAFAGVLYITEYLSYRYLFAASGFSSGGAGKASGKIEAIRCCRGSQYSY